MSLLTICQTALQEDGRFAVPATIIGNADPTAVQLLALANRTGKTLAYDHDWQILLTTYTFPTVASTASYALPSDYHHFSNMTQWDRTNTTQMIGPVNSVIWEALQSGNVVGAGIEKYFRIAGGVMEIYPTPASADTIAYQYYSTYWISGKAAFSADGDVPLLDSDLFILGVRYRFLRSKGLPYQEEEKEYLMRRDSLLASDGGKDMLRFGRGYRISPLGGIPDVNFGL